MPGKVPQRIPLYHIVHVDRLPSIIADGCLRCDSMMARRQDSGTTIGMRSIKQRRLQSSLSSHPGLTVGQCVPFYFCPRSVMLYVIYKANRDELDYRGGQGPIVHLVTNLQDVVAWAERVGRRWAFTLSNAGSRYFEDRCSLDQLDEIDWGAVVARQWSPPAVKEKKQAEFLVESEVPWVSISQIAVISQGIYRQVFNMVQASNHRPGIKIEPGWYY